MGCQSLKVFRNPAIVWEIGVWVVVGTIATTARLCVRVRVRGCKLQGDDYTATLALLCFWATTATSLSAYFLGTNPATTEDELRRLSHCQRHRLLLSNILQVCNKSASTVGLEACADTNTQWVGWYPYATLLWSLKATVLFFLHRLSWGLHQHRQIKLLAALCAMSYLGIIVSITTICRPIQRNWAIALRPPPQCYKHNELIYLTIILNIITDAAILTLPLPLLWQMKVSIKRKIALTLLLCSGIFVITAALINILTATVASLKNTAKVHGNIWATREQVAGILAINAPILKPIFHPSFWRRGFLDPSRAPSLPLPYTSPRGPMVKADARHVVNPIPEQKMKLGILTTIESWATHSSMTSSSYSESARHGPPTLRTDSCVETHSLDPEAGWTALDEATKELARTTPRPLLPEPVYHAPHRTRSHHGGLQAVDEEEQALGTAKTR